MTKFFIFFGVALFVATVSAYAQRTYLQTAIDRSIKPSDDFFAYANGGWLRANDITATESS